MKKVGVQCSVEEQGVQRCRATAYLLSTYQTETGQLLPCSDSTRSAMCVCVSAHDGQHYFEAISNACPVSVGDPPDQPTVAWVNLSASLGLVCGAVRFACFSPSACFNPFVVLPPSASNAMHAPRHSKTVTGEQYLRQLNWFSTGRCWPKQ